jgi:hypothetical protein
MIPTADYTARAMAAWFRSRSTGDPRAFPDQERCAQVTLGDGKRYVLLGTSATVLAVYRVRPCGTLRLLRRWPRAVETAAGWHPDESEEAPHA